MTERGHVTYQGDDPLFLPGSVAPRPDRVERGTVVEVDADWIDALLARGDFVRTPQADVPDVNAPLAVPEPRPEGVLAAEQVVAAAPDTKALAAEVAAFTDPADLAGDALDDALRDAGLTLTGHASDKRDRLADYQDAQRAALAAAVDTAPAQTPPPTAPAPAAGTTTSEG